MRKFCTRNRAYHSHSRKTPAERIFRPVPCTGDIRSYTVLSQPPDCVPALGRYRTYSPEVTRSEPAISRINAILHAERHTLPTACPNKISYGSGVVKQKFHRKPQEKAGVFRRLSPFSGTDDRRPLKAGGCVFPVILHIYIMYVYGHNIFSDAAVRPGISLCPARDGRSAGYRE